MGLADPHFATITAKMDSGQNRQRVLQLAGGTARRVVVGYACPLSQGYSLFIIIHYNNYYNYSL